MLAPISAFGVALEKIVAGAIHAGLAGLVALPAMMLLMHQVSGVDVARAGAPAAAGGRAGLLSAAFGLNLGTRVQPRYSGLLFAVVLGPMMLFGCAYYPWTGLRALGPFQYLFLLNPLVFMSEAMRMAVTPEVPHMPVPLLARPGRFAALFLSSGAASSGGRSSSPVRSSPSESAPRCFRFEPVMTRQAGSLST